MKLIHKKVNRHYKARTEQQEESWINIAQFMNSILNNWDIAFTIKKMVLSLCAGKNSQETSLGVLTFVSLRQNAAAVQVHIQSSQRSTKGLWNISVLLNLARAKVNTSLMFKVSSSYLASFSLLCKYFSVASYGAL